MNELRDSGVDWAVIVGYAVLILLYFVILRLLLNCIEQLTKKHHTQKFAVDSDIHQENAETRIDDSMVGMDIYGRTIAFLRIVIAALAVLGVVIILAVKLNIILAVTISIVAGIVTWRLIHWKKRSEHKYDIIEFVFDKLVSIGGNVGTAIFLVVALIVVALGLVLLS